MQASEIRQKYLNFFGQRGHCEVAPSPLVPENDPTTLFTSSGMQPLVPYLLGEKHPLGKKLVNVQRSFRSQDIDEVGDNRHTTFFEMLGNWSLGDYFKKEQLRWFFEFLTQELKLVKERLFVSVFIGNDQIPKDEESAQIWQDLGLAKSQIFYYDVDKNWWSRSGPPDKMPEGEPGGPDSEVFYDLKIPHQSFFGKTCHPNCDCGRFLEIGNSVFMEYKKIKQGFTFLPQKNVDFGGGLERLTMAVNNQPDVFKIDLFSPLIHSIEKISGKSYKEKAYQKPMRIIADHLKAATFMIADGVVPSNKMQGYILRRLIRRALVYAHGLALTKEKDFLKSLVTAVVLCYQDYYTYLSDKQKEITLILEEELTRFEKTLEKGLKEINRAKNLDGRMAFKLYETYGFPWEMTYELAKQKGQTLNKADFDKEFAKHQQLSRTTSSGLFKGGLADQSEKTTKLHTATHLLHAALRKILGQHVVQKGSHITAERLRFDFTHPRKLSASEIQKIEDLVNKQIKRNLTVSSQIMSYQEAIRIGALGFFTHRYQAQVKVYTIGDFSKEICGGPHVNFTSSLGQFKIKKEEAVSAGVRRIYAVLLP